jgi:hypothetical protein
MQTEVDVWTKCDLILFFTGIENSETKPLDFDQIIAFFRILSKNIFQ